MTKMDVMSINIHRMFEYLFCADESSSFLNLRFENDVKMYGTQTRERVNFVTFVTYVTIQNVIVYHGRTAGRVSSFLYLLVNVF